MYSLREKMLGDLDEFSLVFSLSSLYSSKDYYEASYMGVVAEHHKGIKDTFHHQPAFIVLVPLGGTTASVDDLTRVRTVVS